MPHGKAGISKPGRKGELRGKSRDYKIQQALEISQRAAGRSELAEVELKVLRGALAASRNEIGEALNTILHNQGLLILSLYGTRKERKKARWLIRNTLLSGAREGTEAAMHDPCNLTHCKICIKLEKERDDE